MIHRLYLLGFLLFLSCSNDVSEVDKLTEPQNFMVETGKYITILYSDSAVVKVRITSDSLVRHLERSEPRDVFPSGIFIEFLSDRGNAVSWLKADKAIRNERTNEFTVMGNVRLYNRKNDKLLSTELVWDENKSILKTEKFVSVIQAERRDTTYGFGFESNEDFNIFEIKRRTSAVFLPDSFKK